MPNPSCEKCKPDKVTDHPYLVEQTGCGNTYGEVDKCMKKYSGNVSNCRHEWKEFQDCMKNNNNKSKKVPFQSRFRLFFFLSVFSKQSLLVLKLCTLMLGFPRLICIRFIGYNSDCGMFDCSPGCNALIFFFFFKFSSFCHLLLYSELLDEFIFAIR
jgi:hypothetical protein